MDGQPSYLKIKHLSYSQLRLYQECPFKYYLKYIQGAGEAGTRIEFVLGTAFHKGMQEMYKYRDFEKGKVAFRDDVRHLGENREVDNLVTNMSLYHTMYFDNYIDDFIGSEVKFEMHIPGIEVPVIGYIDNLLKRGFIDYKTTSSFKAKEAYDIKQFATYAMWFLTKFRAMPAISEAHVFNKLKAGEDAINIVSERITHDMVNMLMAEYVQMWRDIKAERWTPNLSAWSANDQYYDLACKYAESITD
jgi:hypothetical protein